MSDNEKMTVSNEIDSATNFLAEHYDLTRDEVTETLEKLSDMKSDELRMSEAEIDARDRYLYSEIYYLTYVRYINQKMSYSSAIDHDAFDSVLQDISVEFDEFRKNKKYESFIALVNGRVICEVFIDDDGKTQAKFYNDYLKDYIETYCDID